jgi:hypothetical protein
MRQIRLLALAVLSASVVVACADLSARLRRHTYPPNFKYIGRAEVRSAMWQLASEVSQLDDLMRQPGPIDEARRAQLMELLSAMEDTTRDLETHGRPTNHPLIADHLEGFQRALATARAAVAAERPNYYLAGSVSGACLICHGPDR